MKDEFLSGMVGICRFVTAYEWVVLALMLPLVLFPSPERALVLLLIPVLWLVRWVATGHLVPPTPLDWSLFGLLLMVLVSQYATFDMAHSLVKIAGLVYGLAVFYAVVQWIGYSFSRLWWGIGVLYLLVLGLVGVSLVVFGWMGAVPGLGSVLAKIPAQITALASRSVNPNQVAGILLWLLPLAMLLAATVLWQGRDLVNRFGWWRVGLLVLVLIGASVSMLGVLLLTRSRGALAGMVAALVVMGLVGITAVSRKLTVILIISLLVVSMVGVALSGPEKINDTFFAQVGIDSENPLTSIDGRLEIWSRAIYGLQDFPFTGMGMNNFRKVVHVLYPLFLIPPSEDIAHAHNHWLQAGLDLGIPGMIAYMAVWLGLAFMLWWSWQRAQDIWLQVLALGFIGCLVAYFVYGLLDTIALGARPGFVFWGMVGLIAGLHQVVRFESRKQKAEGRMDGLLIESGGYEEDS